MCATPSARLWVVATPLGNPGDLSPRAREVLAAADLLLAEDTRRAGLLFQRLGIRSKGFLSLFEHNEEARIGTVLAALERGESVALFSDAGTPLLSDPGFRLVRACREAGFAVSPVPGPSAPAAALSASGLPPQPFVFLGFLPRKDGDIRRFLEPFAALPATRSSSSARRGWPRPWPWPPRSWGRANAACAGS
jgi:16S rRNA (cytidine1402-2'-O)-methyltransferase